MSEFSPVTKPFSRAIVALLALCVALSLISAGCERGGAGAGSQTGGGQSSIEGRVTYNGEGIAMAWVEVYEKPERDQSTPPVAETASGEDGSFAISVAPGRYWVWAKATVDGGVREHRLVGEAVPSPVEPRAAEASVVEIELSDAGGFATGTGPAGGGGAKGVVKGVAPSQDAGQLQTRARVSVYVYQGKVARPVGPNFVAAVDVVQGAPGGAFTVDLAPGVYTLAARLRESGRDYGPPDVDDRIAVATVEVPPGEYAEVGELVLSKPDPERWKDVTATLGQGTTTVSGKVVNADSTPVAGLRVLAFEDSRMAGKPLSVSPLTGEDGAFTVSLPGGGRYFFGARSRIGGPSSPGEKVGAARGEDGGGIEVAPGSMVEGLVIEVEEVW